MQKIKIVFHFSLCLALMTGFKSYGQAAFSYTLNPITGCAPVTVQFTDLSSGATSWSWDLDNGSTASTLQNPSVTYSTPNTYHVTLTINGGTSIITHDIVVYASPTASFSVSDTTICTGSSITFTSTSTAGSGSLIKWKWGFGDGSVDSTTGATVTHVYGSQNTFTVSLQITNSNGCYAQSATFNVTVVNGPVANFNTNILFSCSVPVTIIFSNASTGTNGSTTYSWNFGDTASSSNTANTANSAHTYTASGDYTITFGVSNGGCTATHIYTLHVEQFIAAGTLSSDTVCISDPVIFTDVSTPASVWRSWDFGDGTNSNSPNPSHFFPASGTYNIILISSSANCSDTITYSVFIRPQPVINFSVVDSVFCQPFLVTFTPTSSTPIASAIWDYEFDSGIDADSIAPYEHFYSVGDSVELIVTDIYGCKDTLVKPDFIRVIPPTATYVLVPDSGCKFFTKTFDASGSTSPTDPIVNYTWNFGDSTASISSSSSIATHTYNSLPHDTGIFTVTLTVTTARGCTATYSYPDGIKIGYPPVAAFGYSPSVICFGDTLFLSDSSTVAPPAHVTGWLWNFSDGGSSLEQNPFHVCINDTGTFNIQLIAYFNGCPDTLEKDSVFIVHPPNPDFIVLPHDCAHPYDVTFVDISKGADSITFDFGDGTHQNNLSEHDTITHTYSARGIYTVTDSAWNFQYGCQWQKEHTISITDPLARITPDDTVKCYPAVFYFTGSGSQDASSYLWNFGDPASGVLNTSQSADTLHVFSLPGYYTVSLTISDQNNCVSTVTKTIHVRGPIAGFTVNNITGCVPLVVNFTDTSRTDGGPIVQWIWDFEYPSAPVTLSTNTASHTYNSSNFYNIYLTVVDANGCTDTTLRPSFIIATFPNPVWASLDTFVCPGSVNGTAIDAGSLTPSYTVIWNFGDGSIPDTVHNSGNILHTYTTENVFILTVTVIDSNGCTNLISRPITVLRPVANINQILSQSQCGSTQVDLFADTGQGIYSWNYVWSGPSGLLGSSSDPSLPHQTFLYTAPGTYTGYLITTNPGCTDTTAVDTFGVAFATAGTYSFIHDSLCSPDTVTFFVHPDSIATITYDFGDGSTLVTTDTIVQHIYYSNGSAEFYTNVTLTFDTSGGSGSCTVPAYSPDSIVNLISYLSVNITQDTVVVPEGEQVILTSVATPPGSYNYYWHVIPTGVTLPLEGTTSATYTGTEGDNSVMLTLSDNIGCQAYDTVIIIFIPCEKMLKIPNVFTPNEDNLNDTYHIDSLCTFPDFRFEIFNRWGNKVFESTDIHFAWNGKNMSGADCSEGTYYYIMYAKKNNLHGYIELIRKK